MLSIRALYRLQPVRPLVETRRGRDCALSGSVEAVRIPLFSDSSSSEPFAVLERGEFASVGLPSALSDAVSAKVAWPLSSSVVLHQDSLPFSLGKSVPVAAPVGWLAAGARVAAARASRDGMVAIARYAKVTSTANFSPSSYTGEIACDDLELPRLAVLFRKDPSARLAAGEGETAELTAAVDIRAEPESKPLAHVGGVDWPISVHRTSGAWALVSDRYAASWSATDAGFDFGGWVPRSNVRLGGLPVAVDLGRFPVVVAHRACGRAKLRLAPTTDAKVVARLAAEVPLLVVSYEQDFARVLLPDLHAVAGGSFWIHRRSLCVVGG